MANQSIVAQVVERINKIVGIDIDSQIINEKKFGELNGFSPMRDDLNQLYGLLRAFMASDLTKVPSVLLEELLSPLDNLEGTLNSMVASIDRNNIGSINNLTNQFKSYCREVIVRASTILMLIAHSTGRVPEVEIAKRKNEFTTFIDQSKDEAKRQLDTAKEVIARLSDQAKSIGVLSYTTAFTKEARKFRLAANWWLFFSILFFLTIVIVGTYILTSPEILTIKNTDLEKAAYTYELIQSSVMRILIVSALFYGLTTSIRTYKSNKHNEILNSHRHNALTAFEAFSNASSADLQTKNAVLLEATHAIFGHQITGFTPGEKDSDVPIKILEVLRSPTASAQ